MSRDALEAGLDTEALVALGESILAYIEELSAASAEGFAFEQSERAGEMDRRRVDLLELLLHGTADDVAAQEASAAAGWVLPNALVAVTCRWTRRPASGSSWVRGRSRWPGRPTPWRWSRLRGRPASGPSWSARCAGDAR